MFSEKYNIFLDDLETKLSLVTNPNKEMDLLKTDLKSLIPDLFYNLAQEIDFKKIELCLDQQQKVDIDAIVEGASLFNKEEFLQEVFIFPDGHKKEFNVELNHLLKVLKTIKTHEIKLGMSEVALRLEWFANGTFENLIYILGEKAPTKQLEILIKKKVDFLNEQDINTLWSYIKNEFRDTDNFFAYDEQILGKNFLEDSSLPNLRKKIIQYIAYLRANIVKKKIINGKTSIPIFAFGIARLLSISERKVKDLDLNETTVLRIIHRIGVFWEKILCGDKNKLWGHLGISAAGRIACLNSRDLDHTLDDTWIDFGFDKAKNYKIIISELRKLLKIVDTYPLKQSTQNTAGIEKQEKTEDIIDVKPNFCGIGVNLNAFWKRHIVSWWKKLWGK